MKLSIIFDNNSLSRKLAALTALVISFFALFFIFSTPAFANEPVDGGTTVEVTGGASPTGFSGPEDIACDAGSFTWIICRVVKATVDLVDFMREDVLEPFLYTTPVLAESQEPLFQIWQAIRNIAYGLLVPIFLLMIIMQAIGGGAVEAYAVRKILPRVFIAALGISISIYVAAILIDIFNVLGLAIDGVITSIGESNSIDIGNGTQAVLGGLAVLGIILGTSSASILVAGLVGVNAGLAIGFIALFIVIPVILALVILFGTLVFRQVLIMMLVIVSPLAFLAWVLPSTERFAKKWFEWFMKALMMYPLIILLLSSGGLFASLLSNTDDPNFLADISGIAAVILPMFVVYKVPDLAGDTLRAVNGGLQNFAGKTRERARGDMEDPFSRQNRFRRQMHDKSGRHLANRGGLVAHAGSRYANSTSRGGRVAHAIGMGARRGINMAVSGRMPEAYKNAVADLEYGGEMVKNLIASGDEDSVFAASFTGGDSFRGSTLSLAGGGSAYSARLKKDILFAKQDANGQWVTTGRNADGSVDDASAMGAHAMVFDAKAPNGVRAATSDDFYDDNTVKRGKSLAHDSPGFLVDATRETIRQSQSKRDVNRAIHGFGTSSSGDSKNTDTTRFNHLNRAWLLNQDNKGYMRGLDTTVIKKAGPDGKIDKNAPDFFQKDAFEPAELAWDTHEMLSYQKRLWNSFSLQQMDAIHFDYFADGVDQIYDSSQKLYSTRGAEDMDLRRAVTDRGAAAAAVGLDESRILEVMRGEEEFTDVQKEFLYKKDENGNESGVLHDWKIEGISMADALRDTYEKAADVAGESYSGARYVPNYGADVAAGEPEFIPDTNAAQAAGATVRSARKVMAKIKRLGIGDDSIGKPKNGGPGIITPGGNSGGGGGSGGPLIVAGRTTLSGPSPNFLRSLVARPLIKGDNGNANLVKRVAYGRL